MRNDTGGAVAVDPDAFLREQGEKHAHVQVTKLGPVGAGAFMVVGYDADWREQERTRLLEDGTVLPNADAYTIPDPLAEQENRDAC